MRAYNAERRLVRSPSTSALKALARKALDADRKVAEARAARRRVAAEHKALAAEVLAPALAALRAAVSALETLMGPPATPMAAGAWKSKETDQRTSSAPSKMPPIIRTIDVIVADDRVSAAEAKRIQEHEIVARAAWRRSTNTNGSKRDSVV